MTKRIKFDTNYTKDGWYFVLGISFVPDEAYLYTLGLELGFWHIEIGIGRKL